MSKRRHGRWVLLLIVTLGTGPAVGWRRAIAQPPAQEKSPDKGDKGKDAAAQAREHYQTGLRYYNLADYPQAIREFRRAYELSAAPELLFNIGQAHRLNGDCETALRLYKNYLREATEARNRGEVDAAIARCEGQLGPQPATPPAATAISPPGLSPPTAGANTGPPAAPPSAAAPGETAPLASGLSGADPSPPPAEAERASAGELVGRTAPPASPGAALRIGGMVAGGVGLGMILAGVTQGVRAGKKADDVDAALKAQRGFWNPAIGTTDAEGRAAAARAGLFYATGAAAVVAGGVLYWLGHRAGKRAQVAFTQLPGGVSGRVGISF